jgi:hypothetical protein
MNHQKVLPRFQGIMEKNRMQLFQEVQLFLFCLGIPTVMWGRPDCGKYFLGDDFVTLRGVEEEGKIMGRLLIDMLG